EEVHGPHFRNQLLGETAFVGRVLDDGQNLLFDPGADRVAHQALLLGKQAVAVEVIGTGGWHGGGGIPPPGRRTKVVGGREGSAALLRPLRPTTYVLLI